MRVCVRIKRGLAASALLGAGLFVVAGSAAAEASWPARHIRIIVPFVAGVSSDTVARILSDHLSRALGQPVVVENRAGAAGIIGRSRRAQFSRWVHPTHGGELNHGNQSTHLQEASL